MQMPTRAHTYQAKRTTRNKSPTSPTLKQRSARSMNSSASDLAQNRHIAARNTTSIIQLQDITQRNKTNATQANRHIQIAHTMTLSGSGEAPQEPPPPPQGEPQVGPPTTTTTSVMHTRRRAPLVDEAQRERLLRDDAMRLPDMGIVVSGIAGRFPKADSVNEYEQHLYEGTDMVADEDSSRFECRLWGLPPRFGRLKSLAQFDCEFFGYTPDEANHIDYQLRLLYEAVYESILDAGINPATLRGSRTGVFFGVHTDEFENALHDQADFKPHGYYLQYAARIAQYFDFRGITSTYDAACASGFVGFHEAVHALHNNLVDQAIVCSSNITVHPSNPFIFLQMQMLSPTGYSRFLDGRSDGYVKSEACVSLLLQRKHLAKRNYASLLATMTSADGYKREGITFPSDRGQASLIRATKRLAGVSTNHVECIEAHGTGTPAGDPQEVRALSRVYFPKRSLKQIDDDDDAVATGEQQQEEQQQQEKDSEDECDDEDDANGDDVSEQRVVGPLMLGSSKTNMGHAEAVSGLCALTKVALQLENEIMYAGLHFKQPNTNIKSLVDGRVEFVGERRKLTGKIIPLSCYGFGGANVHVIVRANERPMLSSLTHGAAANTPDAQQSVVDEQSVEQAKHLRLVVMFGRSEAALNEFFDRLLDVESRQTRYCLTNDFLALVDSLSAHGRIDRLMSHRGYALVDMQRKRQVSRSVRLCELARVDKSSGKGDDDDDDLRSPHFQEARERPIQFVFPGLGCQWPAMGAGLRDFGAFWSTIERLARVLQDECQYDLVDVMTNAHNELMRTTMVGPVTALVAYEIALTNFVRDELKLNNIVDASHHVVGHSIGEVAAAYACGVLDEREAVLVAHHIARVLDERRALVGGKMVSLGASEADSLERIRELCAPNTSVRVSCINGPESTTISGTCADVDAFVAQLGDAISARHVPNSQATHNDATMSRETYEAIRDALEPILGARDRTRPPNWLSSVAGDARPQADSDYFARNICNQVRFYDTVQRLPSDSVALELAPMGTFGAQFALMSDNEPKLHHCALMRHSTPAAHQVRALLEGVGRLYELGATFDLVHLFNNNNNKSSPHTQRAPVDYPVRRQTPSLSSLFKWQHEHEMFVPRYPQQFGKSSSRCEFCIDMLEERYKYLTGHCVEGRVLHPATGYLYLAWRVFSYTKRKMFDVCFQDVERELMPIEFSNVRLMRAVMLSNRTSEIHVQYEEATGKFEIKEGGSLVADGYARSPESNPNGLLYESVRDQIRSDILAKQATDNAQEASIKTDLNSEDIYRQFRVCGYDYGDTFRCVESTTRDGRYARIKFNGHFVALTDNILQAFFLAFTQHAALGDGIALPTKFEYVRFQPAIILAKIHAARMEFDRAFRLDNKKRREIMFKLMERDPGAEEVAKSEQDGDETQPSDTAKDADDEAQEPATECIFETYSDPITGVVITDGIEVRGAQVTPVPRRVDTNEVLLETYAFVRDHEAPVDDEILTRHQQLVEPYVRVCDALASDLLCAPTQVGPADGKTSLEEALAYMSKHLTNRAPTRAQIAEAERDANNNKAEADKATESGDKADAEPKKTVSKKNEVLFDIKRNGVRTLLSVLDLLRQTRDDSKNDEAKREDADLNAIVARHWLDLQRDMVHTRFACERLLRPLLDTVVENACQRKMKLNVLEVNVDDGLLRDPTLAMLKLIEPTLSIDYQLAHPDGERLISAKLVASEQASKTYKLLRDDPQSTFTSHNLKNLDLVLYRDASCYGARAPTQSDTDLGPLFGALDTNCKPGGFVLVVARTRLTLAERLLGFMAAKAAPVEPKTDEQDDTKATKTQEMASLDQFADADANTEQRCNRILDEAARNNMTHLATKTEPTGTVLYLFKTSERAQKRQEQSEAKEAAAQGADKTDSQQQHRSSSQTDDLRVVVHVRNVSKPEDAAWVEELKLQFKSPEKEKEEQDQAKKDADEQADKEAEGQQVSDEKAKEAEPKKEPEQTEQQDERKPIVWLCAVATRDAPINGVVGMMQALRKELGSSRLRCFFDMHTFCGLSAADVTNELVETSAHFKAAMARNTLWYCVEASGVVGTYRHLRVNDQLNYADCACGEQPAAVALGDDAAACQRATGAYMHNAKRGDLSSFAWFEAPLKYASDEQQASLVQVAYAALNFRDVMLATGRLPPNALPIRTAQSDCQLGLEFSGVDARGKRVMGIVPERGLATHLLCEPRTSIRVPVPDWCDLRQAATIPVVYATAAMALMLRGRARRGESVLIHAGSGGVGQAALHLAAHYGLEVYTTVGSADKRKFLLDEFKHILDESRVFDSRSCDFERDIMHATRGRGVDMVLNSLADDKLHASVRCLADGGRFLEIGKYDLAMDATFELLKLDTNKTFHGIHLDKLFEADEQQQQQGDAKTSTFERQIDSIKRTLRDGLEQGYIKPIKYTVFKSHEIENAFRFMATGKHVGKVIVEIDANLDHKDGTASRVARVPAHVRMRCVPRAQFSPTKTYIVTGGLGGFGLELVKWLVGQGVRRLVLTSRTGVRSAYQRWSLRTMERVSGASVRVVTQEEADAMTRDGAHRLLDIARAHSDTQQLGAIFHLAMVLRDAMLENMDASHFVDVCRPKVDACEHLDALTRTGDFAAGLDYFVVFSSVSCGKGNAGQSNYAYANSCMERIVERRRAANLHALAVQWGAIGDVGVAYEALGGNDVVVGGTRPQRMPSCMATLAKLLESPFTTCLSVLPVNRNSEGIGAKTDLVAAIFHVLGIKDVSKVSEQATLGELGLDSLMAVEIRQYIEREHDMTLNIQEIRALTIEKIREISEGGGGANASSTAPASAKKAATAKEAAESGGAKSANAKDAADEVRTATGYGQLDQAAKLAANKRQAEQKANEMLVTRVDAQLRSFMPELELATEDFLPLNTAAVAAANDKSLAGGRPIFFLPPINNKFDLLQDACELIERPCFGINWTRRFGCLSTIDEIIETYVELLERRADVWSPPALCNGSAQQQQQQQRVVDIVGYSYGATIAFELMLALHRQTSHAHALKPGRLVLLDGSPKVFKLSAQYIASFSHKKELSLADQVDEMLMGFFITHSRGALSQINFIELHKSLAQLDIENKVKLVSEKLAALIVERDNKHIQDDNSKACRTKRLRRSLYDSIESFCRRCEILHDYKPPECKLPADCTLIRAEKLYFDARGQSKLTEELGLSSMLDGQLHLHILKGDHESFIADNKQTVAAIIVDQSEL